jgi:hypothetical protein
MSLEKYWLLLRNIKFFFCPLKNHSGCVRVTHWMCFSLKTPSSTLLETQYQCSKCGTSTVQTFKIITTFCDCVCQYLISDKISSQNSWKNYIMKHFMVYILRISAYSLYSGCWDGSELWKKIIG